MSIDTEQLRLVLDTLKGLGVEGKQAFIWWLVLDKVFPGIIWLVTFSGIIYLVKQLLMRVKSAGLLQRLRDDLEIGYPGEFSDAEVHKVVNKVRDLQEQVRHFQEQDKRKQP